LNKFHGTHALRERARKLDQGILRIRFELPYNIFCSGCGNHVGMGVRYNADKSKVGNYYSTPIWKFRMKCHLCDNYIEFQTDPKNCDYVILSGASRHNQRWEQQDNEGHVVDRDESSKMADDPMYKLEHGIRDEKKAKEDQPRLTQIEEMQMGKKDDFALNQLLRKKFRTVKKEIQVSEEKDRKLLAKASLDIPLLAENHDDIQLATTVRFHSQLEKIKEKRRALKQQSIFDGNGRLQSSQTLSNNRLLVDHKNFRSISGTKEETLVGVIKRKKCSESESKPPEESSVALAAKSLVSDEYGSNTDSDS
jgi:coiled-coil domain-containing protein 130